MPIGGGIALLIVGAILAFAVTTGSVRGVDLSVVGVILMLGGALGLLLPLLVRARRRPNGMTARSRQDVIDEGPHTRVEPPRYDSSRHDDRRTPDDRRPDASPTVNPPRRNPR